LSEPTSAAVNAEVRCHTQNAGGASGVLRACRVSVLPHAAASSRQARHAARDIMF
jgi:hypothetical protein